MLKFSLKQWKLGSRSFSRFFPKKGRKHKFTVPTIRGKTVIPIFPSPGYDLILPGNIKIIYLLDWSVEKFFTQIGGDTVEYSGKFENLESVFKLDSYKVLKIR